MQPPGGRGQRIDRTIWPSDGPWRRLLEHLDTVHVANNVPSLRRIGVAMHLAHSRVRQLVRGEKLPVDEAQVTALVEAMGGVGGEVSTAVRLYQAIRPEDRHAPRGGPWTVPTPARDLITRQNLADRLVELLCADDTDGGAVAVTAGVHGTGGFGKTTLVAQVCRRPQVQAAFPGGLVWVTVGESASGPQLAAMINDVVERLSGQRPLLVDVEQAGFSLGEELDARPGRVLLIVDDVWRAEQLRPFLHGGTSCVRLVTTRDQRLVPPDRTLWVDAMQPGEARALLTRSLVEMPAALVDELLDLTGRWPVLLDLTNRALHRAVSAGADPGTVATRTAARLRAAGPAGLDPLNLASSTARNEAVAATVAVSLDLLPAAVRDRYLELGIFPDDSDIPLPVLELLWGVTGGLDPVAVEQVCAELFDLSLVLAFRHDPPSIRLHDVLRAHLRTLAGEKKLADGHRQLLDAATALLTPHPHHRDSDDATAWWTLPDTHQYLIDNLASHLVAAGRRDDVDRLLNDLRWAEARLRGSGPAALEADLAHTTTPTAAALARAVRQNGHLLGPTEPTTALGATLASRLDGIAALQPAVRAYTAQLPRPVLTNRWPVPDRPHPALRRTLPGHPNGVSAVAIAPDGSWLATGGHDGTVRIWDAATGTERHMWMTGHPNGVSAVAIAPDGSWLATGGGDDDTVRIWDPVTGAERRTWFGHSGVWSVAIAPDGSWLATGGTDGGVRIWDAATGDRRRTLLRDLPLVRDLPLADHTDRVRAVAIAPDGSWLATGGDDGAVWIWDAATGTERHTRTRHGGGVLSVAIGPDGSWLATGGDDGAVRIWDAATGTERHTLTGDLGGMWSVAIAPDGSWLAGTGPDGAMLIWDIADRRICTAVRCDRPMYGCGWLPGGTAVYAYGDAGLYLFDLVTAA